MELTRWRPVWRRSNGKKYAGAHIVCEHFIDALVQAKLQKESDWELVGLQFCIGFNNQWCSAWISDRWLSEWEANDAKLPSNV